MAPPSRAQLWLMPWMVPRSDARNHGCIARVVMGKVPLAPSPVTKRSPNNDANPPPKPISRVAADQNGTSVEITRRGPNRSASQPDGICPTT